MTDKHKHLYNDYLHYFKQFNTYDKDIYFVRVFETCVEEAGFKGTSTGLISVEALQSKIKKAKGMNVSNLENVSLEHPITYRNIVLYCLDRKTPLTFKNFIKVWKDNLITTIVTVKQNRMLIKFQKHFRFGIDCWKKMYKKAGVVIVNDVDLRKDSVRKKYGLPSIQRGRKKGIK